MDFRKPIKTVSIDSPADLDRTTTQGLGKANPMVEVINFLSQKYSGILQYLIPI